MNAGSDAGLGTSGYPLIDHAAREHGTREIVTRWADGSENAHQLGRRPPRCAEDGAGLRRLGLQPGDRVATLAMNHTAIWPLVWRDRRRRRAPHRSIRACSTTARLHRQPCRRPGAALRCGVPADRRPDEAAAGPRSSTTSASIDAPSSTTGSAAEDGNTEWAAGDERDPCMLCYTSGTTGNPKGVLYEHRSTMLHAIAEIAAGGVRFRLRAAWCCRSCRCSTPQAGACPGRGGGRREVRVLARTTNRPMLCELMLREGVTHTAGRADGVAGDVPASRREPAPDVTARQVQLVIIGGSAAPRAMIERLMKAGVRVAHAWGMTETSPDRHDGFAKPGLGRADASTSRSISSCKQGRIAVRRRTALRRLTIRQRRCRATARPRRAAGARAVGDQALFQGRGRCGRRGPVVRHRRRRGDPPRWHAAD